MLSLVFGFSSFCAHTLNGRSRTRTNHAKGVNILIAEELKARGEECQFWESAFSVQELSPIYKNIGRLVVRLEIACNHEIRVHNVLKPPNRALLDTMPR
jgi:hypothetical protein